MRPTPPPMPDELPIHGLVDRPIAYRMAVAVSMALGLSWLGFLACLGATPLSSQGIPLAHLALQGALLIVISTLFVVVSVSALARLAFLRHPKLKAAAIWCLVGLSVPVIALSISHQAIAVAI